MRGSSGAHASFTLDDEALAGCVDLARELGVGVHIHAAEDPIDEHNTLSWHGYRLLDRFEHHGLLDLPGTIIAHGTHFTDADVARINAHAKTVTMAHCPRSNMNNGVGYAAPVRYQKPAMLGTDGIGATYGTKPARHFSKRATPADRLRLRGCCKCWASRHDLPRRRSA